VGVQLKQIIEPKKITFETLSGNKIAVDAFNTLYQFITIIRQRDGTPLMNSRGKITSHISGLFYRTSKLMEMGIRPCYVFDGKPPAFKLVGEKRRERKEDAEAKLKDAKERGDEEGIRTYSEQSARLEQYMVEDSLKLLKLLGIPTVLAPSEGEAQAAYMAKKGDVWAVGSQDWDSLLFGAPRLVKNLTITGRRKLPRKNAYIDIVPELIELSEVSSSLGLGRDELISIGMLVGTDFNPGGVKGFGPKRALELVREKGVNCFDGLPWDEAWPSAGTIRDFFTNPPHTDDYELLWSEPDSEGLIDFLVGENEFSEDRVQKSLDAFRQGAKKGKQAGLGQWF
jgi:flap endonuclease-1